MYSINIIDDMADIDRGNLAPIDIYNWGGEYRPLSFARLCYVKNKGFGIKLWSEETPVATYQADNSMVCKDSCLEFFADFKPQDKSNRYLNIEGNANGCILAEFGKPCDRHFLTDIGLANPKAIPFRDENKWGYTMLIPLELLEKTFGGNEYKVGDIITASFFKCGDDTGKPHYGSFVKIDWECPSFHRPQFFTEMKIVE